MQYTTKDGTDVTCITISKIGRYQVAETDVTTEIERVMLEYNSTTDRAKRKELRNRYESLLPENNSTNKIYNSTL